MSTKTYTKTILLVGLVVLSIGGILLHSRIHPFKTNHSNIVPVISCCLSILIVPTLFCFRKTVSYAFALNSFLVLVGTVTMAHFSIAHWPNPATVQTVIMNTLLADILILWGKFFVGKSIYELELYGYDIAVQKTGKTYYFSNMGWWIVHLIAVSAVYSIGHILWR